MIGPRIRTLNWSGIAELLSTRAIEVVADVGEPLRWIDAQCCCDFWKSEGKPHLVKDGSRFDLEEYPDGYCYAATKREDSECEFHIQACATP